MFFNFCRFYFVEVDEHQTFTYFYKKIGSPIPDPAYNKLMEDIESGEFEPTLVQIIGVGVVGVAALALVFFAADVIAFVGTIIVGITGAVVTVSEALFVIGKSIMGIFAQIVG